MSEYNVKLSKKDLSFVVSLMSGFFDEFEGMDLPLNLVDKYGLYRRLLALLNGGGFKDGKFVTLEELGSDW